ncbi:hypothetical protein HOE425_331503 [Hoeflea sp. EC-HK425]|nr:hypothetical protein HOE425_331503 [Hoeflea sp. EC-HK425]
MRSNSRLPSDQPHRFQLNWWSAKASHGRPTYATPQRGMMPRSTRLRDTWQLQDYSPLRKHNHYVLQLGKSIISCITFKLLP